MLTEFVRIGAGLAKRSTLLALAIGLSACAGYDVSLNDRLIYTPKELFTDFALSDNALNNCISQTLEYQKATSAAQLTTLNCSGAGITNLAGLSTFSSITHLKLSVNKVNSIDVLASLTKLQVLHLDENQLTDISVLSALPELETLSLKKNPAIECGAVDSLKAIRPRLQISFPGHCTR
ncbi:MAG: leucine-rich repeat domain-containing protein [Pseudomonadales bacterium]